MLLVSSLLVEALHGYQFSQMKGGQYVCSCFIPQVFSEVATYSQPTVVDRPGDVTSSRCFLRSCIHQLTPGHSSLTLLIWTKNLGIWEFTPGLIDDNQPELELDSSCTICDSWMEGNFLLRCKTDWWKCLCKSIQMEKQLYKTNRMQIISLWKSKSRSSSKISACLSFHNLADKTRCPSSQTELRPHSYLTHFNCILRQLFKFKFLILVAQLHAKFCQPWKDDHF